MLARELTLSHQIGKDAGINGAGARAHHETLQRGKTHGRIHASTFANRRQRAAIPQVASHELQRIQILAQQLCRSLCAILMVDPMESVAANSLLEPLVRTRVSDCR